MTIPEVGVSADYVPDQADDMFGIRDNPLLAEGDIAYFIKLRELRKGDNAKIGTAYGSFVEILAPAASNNLYPKCRHGNNEKFLVGLDYQFGTQNDCVERRGRMQKSCSLDKHYGNEESAGRATPDFNNPDSVGKYSENLTKILQWIVQRRGGESMLTIFDRESLIPECIFRVLREQWIALFSHIETIERAATVLSETQVSLASDLRSGVGKVVHKFVIDNKKALQNAYYCFQNEDRKQQIKAMMETI